MKIRMLLTFIFLISFLIGCSSQEIGSLEFSDSAKQELQQLLQKSSPDAFDIKYNFYTSIAGQKLVDITFRNIKQEKNQRQEVDGNMLGFNLSAYSITNDVKQVTCALFNNSWGCSAGNEVCKETSNGKMCYSVEQEGIPPTIKPEQLAKAKVAKTEQKEILGMQVQCYKLLTAEGGNKALMEACFNQEGVVMSIAINAKLFQGVFEAKSYSTNINPELFVMPTAT